MSRQRMVVGRMVAVALLCLVAGGCRGTGETATQSPEQASGGRFEFARVLMGSRARVLLHAPSEDEAARAAAAAFAEIERLNRILSDYDDSSEAMRLCAAPHGAWHPASPELIDILAKSRSVWERSDGAFDPTVGALTQLWRDTKRTGVVPPASVVEAAGERVGMDLVEIDAERGLVRLGKDGMRLDFGGIGKGYAADAARRVLREQGYETVLVDLGGDLAIGAPPPEQESWRIETQTGGFKDTLVLADCAVATSGDTFRFIEIDGVRRSHILDPRPPHDALGIQRHVGATVIADEAWLADALASAISVLGAEDGRRAAGRFKNVQTIVVELPD